MIDGRNENVVSGYFITISTNARPTLVDGALDASSYAIAAELAATVDEVFRQMSVYRWIGVRGTRGSGKVARLMPREFTSEEQLQDPVKELHFRAAVEVGTTLRGGRIHTHVVVQIKHRARQLLRLKAGDTGGVAVLLPQLRELFPRGTYINVKPFNDALAKLIFYAEKNADTAAADAAIAAELRAMTGGVARLDLPLVAAERSALNPGPDAFQGVAAELSRLTTGVARLQL